MSYQVLARKWRPATFEQMVGQSHVLHALTNALTQNRLHHAYLFSGTRGVGKTSLARLFAKGLNCEQGVTATPCGTCSSCIEIAEGRFVDLIEVDAASRTKVDDTRELLDNVQYRPSRGRFKVYLIDEVHMLSRSSFNALLKTLEEPPEHVKFLLATTDPQRLPVTVLSRCLQFNLKSLTQEQISQQLTHILEQEQVDHEEAAINLLAKAANGSMRDALSLTDQSIAFGAGHIKLALVQTMLGTIDEGYVIALLDGLTQGDIGQLMTLVNQVLTMGAQPEEVLRGLLELLHQITLTQFAPAAAQSSAYAQQISHFSEQLNPEQVQLYYQLLLNGRRDLPHAADPKSGLEMALLRAVAFVPEKPVKRWLAEPHDLKPLPSVVDDSKPALSEQKVVNAKPANSQEQTSSHTSKDGPGEAASPVAKAEQIIEAEPAGGVESDDAENAALLSEQALILSQAQSQMHSGQVQESETTSAQREDVSLASGATAIPSSTPTSASKSSSTPTEQVSASNNRDVTGSELKPAVTPEPVADQSFSGDEQIPLEQYAMQSGAMDDDSQDGYFVDEPSQPLFDAPTATNNSLEPVNSLEPGSSPEPINSPESKNSSEQSPAPAEPFDDPLDAVLAARQSLLTDLDAEPAKESDTKKPLSDKKAFVPPTRKPAESPQSASEDESSDKRFGADSARSDKPQAEAADEDEGVSATHATSSEDRPPWEPNPQAGNLDIQAQAAALSAPPTSEAGTANSEPSTQQVQAQDRPSQGIALDNSLEPANSHDLIESHQRSESAVPAVLPPLGENQVTGHDTDLKWYRLMSVLDVGGRVRQLAVNSVCPQFSSPLALLLKPNQKHLAAPIAIEQLQQALANALGEQYEIQIDVGVDSNRETPLEIRQRFHKELLAQADYSLQSDEHIQWLHQFMQIELEPDSISYAPELMTSKGESIELISSSNFSRLPES
ncbi:DNA polymerase III subunit gamma/tau [Shewanella sp. Scap07]|uniref:DNA polymerase III subunit gamma/tau n=1 Tax=Shewanella sp. Scap07 TaxID=2589987 RepID=UPI0015BB78FE|nr:DNA polymerase III subunit gamma/tau [Shewanella sp. Scap07]QLE85925.1 DNA polymerase III subunit gamma/tau [Shewanella sp. Scap07]